MVQFDADPLDGPEIDSNDPSGTAMDVLMYMAGAGVFFALLATAQSTVTPLVADGLGMLPGLNTGGEGSNPGGISFGEIE